MCTYRFYRCTRVICALFARCLRAAYRRRQLRGATTAGGHAQVRAVPKGVCVRTLCMYTYIRYMYVCTRTYSTTRRSSSHHIVTESHVCVVTRTATRVPRRHGHDSWDARVAHAVSLLPPPSVFRCVCGGCGGVVRGLWTRHHSWQVKKEVHVYSTAAATGIEPQCFGQ